jgi:hypothetical protein
MAMPEALARVLAALGRKSPDYRAAFSTPSGRRVRADLYRFCGVMAPSHQPGDPLETAFNEGKRRVGLRIAAMMNDDPEAQRRLIAESLQSEETFHGNDPE